MSAQADSTVGVEEAGETRTGSGECFTGSLLVRGPQPIHLLPRESLAALACAESLFTLQVAGVGNKTKVFAKRLKSHSYLAAFQT